MFAGSHLPVKKHMALLYFWSCETSVTHHVGVSSATVVQWYQYFRDICSWKLLQTPVILGGVGKVVQIDESVMVRAKYHRGVDVTASSDGSLVCTIQSSAMASFSSYVGLTPERCCRSSVTSSLQAPQCGPTSGVHMPNWRHSFMFTKW